MPRIHNKDHVVLRVRDNGHPLPGEHAGFPEGSPFWNALPQADAEKLRDAFLEFAAGSLEESRLSAPPRQGQDPCPLVIERDPESASFTLVLPHPKAEAAILPAQDEGRYRKRYKSVLKKLNLLMESTRQVSWDWDLQTKSLQLLGPQRCILGYRYGELLNDPDFWMQIIHPNDEERVQASLRETLQLGTELWEIEYRCRDANGDYRWIKQIGAVERRDEQGRATSLVGATQLIDEKKRAEQEQLLNFERYRAIVDAQGDAIVRVGSSGRILFRNTTFTERFLPPLGEHRDCDLAEAIRLSPSLKPFHEILARAESEQIDESFMTGNGNQRHEGVLWSARRIEARDGDACEVQFSGRDISALKSLEEALLTSNRQNQAKDRFLAMISHDLRTPLNPILGFAELIARRSPQGGELQEMAGHILSAGKQLLGHLNSLLEISKMDRELHFKQYDRASLASLRNDFESTFSIKAQNKALALAFSLAGPLKQDFIVDLKLLRNTLNNLIDNAIKFTAQGSVQLHLVLESTTSSAEARLSFTVIDEGPGVPQDDLQNIFEPFFRLDDTNSRETEGAGLGLSICKRAMELLQGDITATRNPGSGMTFSGSIPVQIAQPLETAIPDPKRQDTVAPLTERKALIVDDIESNRIVLAEILGEFQLEADACGDGQSALEHIARGGYDIVFLDIHMPGLSGIETMAQIRKLERMSKRPYIVAVTADVTQQNKTDCRDSGIEDFITKPISREKLNRVLIEFRDRQRAG